MSEAPKPLAAGHLVYPSVTIEYCTQCKWMLRAAYYAQELLSTFQSSLAEVSLRPSQGGTFIVSIAAFPPAEEVDPAQEPPSSSALQTKVLWNRAVDGGFPETKELKRRVRDVIDPGRNLGHNDRQHGAAKQVTTTATTGVIASSDEAAAEKKNTEIASSGTDTAEGVSCGLSSKEGCQDCE